MEDDGVYDQPFHEKTEPAVSSGNPKSKIIMGKNHRLKKVKQDILRKNILNARWRLQRAHTSLPKKTVHVDVVDEGIKPTLVSTPDVPAVKPILMSTEDARETANTLTVNLNGNVEEDLDETMEYLDEVKEMGESSEIETNEGSEIETNEGSEIEMNDISEIEMNDNSEIETNDIPEIETNDISEIETNDNFMSDIIDITDDDTNVVKSADAYDVSSDLNVDTLGIVEDNEQNTETTEDLDVQKEAADENIVDNIVEADLKEIEETSKELETSRELEEAFSEIGESKEKEITSLNNDIIGKDISNLITSKNLENIKKEEIENIASISTLITDKNLENIKKEEIENIASDSEASVAEMGEEGTEKGTTKGAEKGAEPVIKIEEKAEEETEEGVGKGVGEGTEEEMDEGTEDIDADFDIPLSVGDQEDDDDELMQYDEDTSDDVEPNLQLVSECKVILNHVDDSYESWDKSKLEESPEKSSKTFPKDNSEEKLKRIGKDTIPAWKSLEDGGTEEQFSWEEYQKKTGAILATKSVFKHVVSASSIDFEPGMKLEVPNQDSSNTYWLATVVAKAGPLILLRYEGYQDDNSADFWTNSQSAEIHPVGWCAKTKHALRPPKAIQHKEKSWYDYLIRHLTGARKAAEHLFGKKQSIVDKLVVGMRLEVIDSEDPSYYWVAGITEIYAGRLRLQYRGTDDSNGELWCYYLWERLHYPGYGRKHSLTLRPPRSVLKTISLKEWPDPKLEKELLSCWEAESLMEVLKDRQRLRDHSLKAGMKLEAKHPNDPSSLCCATVARIFNRIHFLVRIDNLLNTAIHQDDSFICHRDSHGIFPVGWCAKYGLKLDPPKGYNGHFTWKAYLEKSKSVAAPESCFNKNVPEHELKVGMKLETVDQEHAANICVATITQIIQRTVWILIDGDSRGEQICDIKSYGLFPAGWCEMSGHELQWPRPSIMEQKNRISRLRATTTRKTRLDNLRKGREAIRKNAAGSTNSSTLSADGSPPQKKRKPPRSQYFRGGRGKRLKIRQLTTDITEEHSGYVDPSISLIRIDKFSRDLNSEDKIKDSFHLDDDGNVPKQIITIDSEDEDEDDKIPCLEPEEMDFFSFLKVKPNILNKMQEDEFDLKSGLKLPLSERKAIALSSVVERLRGSTSKTAARLRLIDFYKKQKAKQIRFRVLNGKLRRRLGLRGCVSPRLVMQNVDNISTTSSTSSVGAPSKSKSSNMNGKDKENLSENDKITIMDDDSDSISLSELADPNYGDSGLKVSSSLWKKKDRSKKGDSKGKEGTLEGTPEGSPEKTKDVEKEGPHEKTDLEKEGTQEKTMDLEKERLHEKKRDHHRPRIKYTSTRLARLENKSPSPPSDMSTNEIDSIDVDGIDIDSIDVDSIDVDSSHVDSSHEYRIVEKTDQNGAKNKIIVELGKPTSANEPLQGRTAANLFNELQDQNVDTSIKEVSTPTSGKQPPFADHSLLLDGHSPARDNRFLDEQLTEKCGEIRRSKDLPSNPLKWTKLHVAEFVQAAGFGKFTRKFLEQEIDGHALVLLTVHELHRLLGISLGPAVKLSDYIYTLNREITRKYGPVSHGQSHTMVKNSHSGSQSPLLSQQPISTQLRSNLPPHSRSASAQLQRIVAQSSLGQPQTLQPVMVHRIPIRPEQVQVRQPAPQTTATGSQIDGGQLPQITGVYHITRPQFNQLRQVQNPPPQPRNAQQMPLQPVLLRPVYQQPRINYS